MKLKTQNGSRELPSLGSKQKLLIEAFSQRRGNIRSQRCIKLTSPKKEISEDKFKLPISSKIVKKVTVNEKNVLQGLLERYKKENLQKLSEEKELRRRNINEYMMNRIDQYSSNWKVFLREPTDKLEEFLDKIQRDQLWQRKKRNDSIMIEEFFEEGEQNGL